MLRLPPFFYTHALLFALAFLAVLSSTNAAPSGAARSTVVRRADGAYSGPTSFQTVTTTNTAAGLITQTCQVKLTPIKVDGKDMVREEKTCKVTLGESTPPSPSPSSGGTINPPSSKQSNSVTNTATSAAATTTSSSTTKATSAPPSQPTTQSVPPSQSSSSSSSASSSSASVGASPSPSSSSQTSSASQSTPSPSSAPDSSSSSSSAAPSGSAAAATTDAAFQIPGKKLAVLPIGLGVFAGISVIALIVVGLVTYERTKHRKAFRQRKLAEMGQSMGYSGTAGARV